LVWRYRKTKIEQVRMISGDQEAVQVIDGVGADKDKEFGKNRPRRRGRDRRCLHVVSRTALCLSGLRRDRGGGRGGCRDDELDDARVVPERSPLACSKRDGADMHRGWGCAGSRYVGMRDVVCSWVVRASVRRWGAAAGLPDLEKV